MESIWKKPVAAHLKGPSRHPHRETEEQHEKPRDRRRTARDSNRARAEWKSEALPLEPSRTGTCHGVAEELHHLVLSTWRQQGELSGRELFNNGAILGAKFCSVASDLRLTGELTWGGGKILFSIWP
jgi:hypothetical protein